MKTRSTLPRLLMLACLLGLPLCARATTLVVTSLADSGSGTLRSAIAFASSGDTIIFATNGTITLNTALVITNDLSITGPGPTNLIVNGNGQHYSVLAFYGNTTITDNLSGLTIENGIGGYGGGILNESTLDVSNCVITNNTTLSGGNFGFGGGVWNLGVLTMKGCTISGNSAPLDGGAIYNTNTLTLNNCTISGNSVSRYGGGIFNEGMLAVSNSTISGNLSTSLGGGAYNLGTNILNYCTLSDNSGKYGGGIFSDTSAMLTINNSTLSGNSASVYGGGILNQGMLTISNSTLSSNFANDYGGGIYSDTSATLTINNSTLSGNSATINGGGIYDSSVTMLNNCTLAGNSAGQGGGGGIYADSASTLTLNDCTVVGNSAPNGSGGGINNNYEIVLSLTNTIVAGNSAYTDTNILGSFSGANNLTNGGPLLAPLGNYGGPTQTMPPLAGSPAIDAGLDSVTNFLATDQRGYPRLSGAHVDIGAVEVQFVAANPNNPPVLKNAIWSSADGTNTFQYAFTNVSGADFTALTSTNLALPLANWTVLGNIPEISTGQYQFTDYGATNSPQRFYRVVSP